MIDIYSTCTIEKRMRLSRLRRQAEESASPLKHDNSNVSFNQETAAEGSDEARLPTYKTD